MAVQASRLHLATTAGTDIIDVTPKLSPSAEQARNGYAHLRAHCLVHRLLSRLRRQAAAWNVAAAFVCDFDNRPRTREIVVQLNF